MKSEVSVMLLQFRVKNYRSIGDELVIDLTAGKGREHPDFLIVENGVKILPVVGLFGGNASGKSNIIEAIFFMFHNISTSYKNSITQNDTLEAAPFLYDDILSNEPSEREIFIAIGKYEYQYGYRATRREIHAEWLYRRALSTRETKVTTIFERVKNKIDFAEKTLDIFSDLINERNLVLSFIGSRSTKGNKKGMKVFNDIFEWVKANFPFYAERTPVPNELLYILYNAEGGIIQNAFVEFLHEFDSNIEGISWKVEADENGEKTYKKISKHKGKGYAFEMESLGTQKLFDIYGFIFLALNQRRYVLLFDELEAHLHPLILRRIVGMFNDKEINKMGSQLIFSSHNLIVLDKRDLRRDQVWFVEKDKRGFTEAYSLDSFKTTGDEVRSDMNYSKNYLAGRFGAVPYANAGGSD